MLIFNMYMLKKQCHRAFSRIPNAGKTKNSRFVLFSVFRFTLVVLSCYVKIPDVLDWSSMIVAPKGLLRGEPQIFAVRLFVRASPSI